VYADADKAMEKSMHAFFGSGIYLEGARAELVEVVKWPDTVGALRWHMPNLNNHPTPVSLLAEKGKGKNQRRWYVPVRLRWWSEAVVTKNDLPARTLLTKAMLTQKRIDIAGHLGSWWKDVDKLVGTRLTRPLKAGQAVFSSYVKRPQLLRRGDHVTMVVSYGGLKIKASGKVLRSAGVGERIQVQNIKSKKVLQAVVVDAATVHVITGGRG
jgi:flagella basal body P-ring formation protein FlgA